MLMVLGTIRNHNKKSLKLPISPQKQKPPKKYPNHWNSYPHLHSTNFPSISSAPALPRAAHHPSRRRTGSCAACEALHKALRSEGETCSKHHESNSSCEGGPSDLLQPLTTTATATATRKTINKKCYYFCYCYLFQPRLQGQLLLLLMVLLLLLLLLFATTTSPYLQIQRVCLGWYFRWVSLVCLSKNRQKITNEGASVEKTEKPWKTLEIVGPLVKLTR